MVDEKRVFNFLIMLNHELDDVRWRILSKESLPSTHEAFVEVRSKESVRSLMLRSSSVDDQATKKSDEKAKVWCDYCKKPRHTRETCWKLHGKPQHLENDDYSFSWENNQGLQSSQDSQPTSNSLWFWS